jgi:hypothetical protein
METASMDDDDREDFAAVLDRAATKLATELKASSERIAKELRAVADAIDNLAMPGAAKK